MRRVTVGFVLALPLLPVPAAIAADDRPAPSLTGRTSDVSAVGPSMARDFGRRSHQTGATAAYWQAKVQTRWMATAAQ